MKMKYRMIFFCIALACNVCLGERYLYSVGITNAMPDAKLFLDTFYLHHGSPPLGDSQRKSIEGTSVVDSFKHKPYPQIKLTWEVRTGDSVKKYSKTVTMDVPKQFTEKSASGINFVFYDAQILIVYGCSSGYSKKTPDSIGRFYRDVNYIFSDGTPYTLRDFQEYMKQNPGANADDFRKSQKKKYKK